MNNQILAGLRTITNWVFEYIFKETGHSRISLFVVTIIKKLAIIML